MTGRFSHQNGIYTLNDGLSPDSSNIVKDLQGADYSTSIVGKWHLKEKPSGFDQYLVLPGQGRYQNPILINKDNWETGGREYEGFSTDVIADEAIKLLDQRDQEKPFFMMVHFKATHEPFDYPDRYKDLYKDDTFPIPESLYDFSPATNGRTFEGQKLEILANRWVRFQKERENYKVPYPVHTPFEITGLDSIQLRYNRPV